MPLSQNRVSRKLSIAAERPGGATALYNNKIHRAEQPVFQNLAVNHPGAEYDFLSSAQGPDRSVLDSGLAETNRIADVAVT
jgi:hypothetical protein